jgi:hypothetical protein
MEQHDENGGKNLVRGTRCQHNKATTHHRFVEQDGQFKPPVVGFV